MMATPQTALHSRFASCCSSGLHDIILLSSTRHCLPLLEHACKWKLCMGSRPACARLPKSGTEASAWHVQLDAWGPSRALKEACQHVAGIAEEQLDVNVPCSAGNLLQVAWLSQIDTHLQHANLFTKMFSDEAWQAICMPLHGEGPTFLKDRCGNWAFSSE